MDIDYVARLARIDLTASQKQKLTKDLKGILKYIEQLKELKVDKVEPMSHVLPLKNVFREDKVKPSLPAEEALKKAEEALVTRVAKKVIYSWEFILVLVAAVVAAIFAAVAISVGLGGLTP